MKKLFALVLIIVNCMNAFPQATSLTIDCQYPGWLLSYISTNDLPTLRNLTVKGQINSADLAVIGNLVKNYNLQHVDLGDVDIEGNKLSGDMFEVTSCNLRYLSIPKSVTLMESCIQYFDLDTLVCCSSKVPTFKNINSHPDDLYDPRHYVYAPSKKFNVKHLVLRDGATSFNFENNSTIESIEFPNSMKRLEYIYNLSALKRINIPAQIEYLGTLAKTQLDIYGDTLYIPNTVKYLNDEWGNQKGYRGNKGTIKCIYLPDNLDTLFVCSLGEATVDIHIKAKTPPRTIYGLLNPNTIVYVPEGYKEVYKATGNELSGGRYSQWRGCTILEEIYAERIDITSPDIMYVGDSHVLKAEFTPYNTSFTDVTWDVSDKEILSMTQDGTYTALRYGEVQVTAKNADRSCTDTKTIKVYDHTKGINISESSLKLKIREKANLVANTLPLETSDGMITWTTDDELVATVDNNGSVRGVGTGACTITATTVDGGYTATCKVTVTQPVEALTLEKHEMSLKVGETERLYTQIVPANADDKNIAWSSSDEQIATVDAKGNVTGQKAGETWIKAVSQDNEEVNDSCIVTVIQPVTGIQLESETYTLVGIGDSFELKAKVIPDDASNKNIKWTSSNESVCVVSRGKVISVGYGFSVIVANTEDGGYIATCTVNVYEKEDVNRDFKVDVADVASIIDFMSGKSDMVIEQADVNSDGTVDVADIATIIDKMAGRARLLNETKE